MIRSAGAGIGQPSAENRLAGWRRSSSKKTTFPGLNSYKIGRFIDSYKWQAYRFLQNWQVYRFLQIGRFIDSYKLAGLKILTKLAGL